MKIKKCLLLTLITSGLLACSTGSNSSKSTEMDTGTLVPNALLSPLTIDNTGVIPAFTDSTTAVKIYLHNNTNEEIKNIYYTWDVNLPKDNKKAFLKVNSLSANALSSVAPKGVLALPVNIPSLKANIGKGSALLKINYAYDGQQYSFSHLVDFKLVQNGGQDGVYISSGSVSSSFGNDSSGFTTLYVYGSGKPGTIYDITNVDTDPVLGHIVQGDLIGSKIASHQVATVELNTAILNKNSVGSITIGSQLAQKTQKSKSASSIQKAGFISTREVAVLGNESGIPLVVASQVPFVDTASNTGSKLFFYNAGTGTATIANLNGSPGITGVSADSSCTTGFGPGQSCVVSFNLPASSSGSGKITATATNGTSLEVPVTWYNSNANVAQLGLSNDVDAAALLLRGGYPNIGSFNVTITNLTRIPVANLNVKSPQVKSGHATALIESASSANCNGKTLTVNNPSCSYRVSVSDNVSPDNGIINLEVAGSANGALASAFDSLAYKVYQVVPQLALDFSTSSATIYGDNSEQAKSTLTITNLATESSADLGLLNVQPDYKSIAGNPAYEATTLCHNKPLRHGQSCRETVTLKPQYHKTGKPLQASLNYTISANGAAPVKASEALQLTVQPYDSAITLASVTQTGDSSGNGKESTNVAKFLAGHDTDKKVVLTYKNLSTTESMTVSGISFAKGLPAGWAPEYADKDATSCYSDGHSVGKVLAPNMTCTVTLENKLHLLGDSNNVTNLGFNFPTLIINSNGSNHYSFVPGNQLGYVDNKYYANSYQAIITDTSTIENNGTELVTLKVTHTATGIGAGGYNDGIIAEKTQITPQAYLGLPATSDSHCTINKVSGAVVESCNLADDYTVSNSYKINYGTESMVGVDRESGGTLTINYIDLLNGKAWAFNNNVNAATGANVNGGGDYLSIPRKSFFLPKLSNFIFGGYSQWVNKIPDNTLYIFKSNRANGSVFDDKGYIAKITSDLFSGGINAVDSTRNRVFVATGKNTNRVVNCIFNQSTGTIDRGSCQALTNVSPNPNANLTDLVVSRGNLYALDNKGTIIKCQLANDDSISKNNCVMTASDAPQLIVGTGRQQRLMFWDGAVIYTVPGDNTYKSAQYITCKQQADGSLDSCKKLELSLNEDALNVSTAILIPAGDDYVYLYHKAYIDFYSNKSVGCVLHKAGDSIFSSRCDKDPLQPENLPMKWGGADGGSKYNYKGDHYVMYYDKETKHLIGTLTTTSGLDGDLTGSGGYYARGQEFYLIPGSDHTISNLSYLHFGKYTSNPGSYEHFYITDSDEYNRNLGIAIAGDLIGFFNGRLILDTFSIH